MRFTSKQWGAFELPHIKLIFPSFSCAIHQEAKNGKASCGDSYFVKDCGDYFVVAIADGLGSGTEARVASSRAIVLLEQCHAQSIVNVVQTINRQMSGTRGIVFAIAKFFPKGRFIEYASIGNIRFTLYPSQGKRIRTLPQPGYLDGRTVQLEHQSFPYAPGDSFVMYSDGISAHSDWTNALRSATTPAQGMKKIRQLWERQNDDITVIVGR